MQTWRDHISPDEKCTVLSEYDDGSAVCLSGYAGGGSILGVWGSVTLMKIEANGSTTFRTYKTDSDWATPSLGKTPH